MYVDDMLLTDFHSFRVRNEKIITYNYFYLQNHWIMYLQNVYFIIPCMDTVFIPGLVARRKISMRSELFPFSNEHLGEAVIPE